MILSLFNSDLSKYFRMTMRSAMRSEKGVIFDAESSLIALLYWIELLLKYLNTIVSCCRCRCSRTLWGLLDTSCVSALVCACLWFSGKVRKVGDKPVEHKHLRDLSETLFRPLLFWLIGKVGDEPQVAPESLGGRIWRFSGAHPHHRVRISAEFEADE